MISRLVFIVISCFLLSSCNYITPNIENLIEPPKLNKEQARIYKALETGIGNADIKLAYPKNGNYRSSFVFKDIDKDAQEEVLVFYTDTQTPNRFIRIHIVDYIDGEWVSITDVAGGATNIEFIDFAKLNDEDTNIIIGWKNATEQFLSVYKFENNEIEKIYNDYYSNMIVYDFNEDGKSEMVLIYDATGYRTPYAKLIYSENNRLTSSENIPLNTNILEVKNLSVGNLTPNQKAVFIDGTINNALTSPNTGLSRELQMIYTEILVYEDHTLKNLYPNSAIANAREDGMYCTDIDKDGIIEVPFAQLLPGYEQESETRALYETKYQKYKNGLFTQGVNTLVNNRAGYLIKIPKKWVGKITVINYPETNEWRFYEYGQTINDKSKELFRIRVYSNNEYQDKFESQEYFTLEKKGVFEYAGYIPPTTSQLATSKEELMAIFELLV